MILSSYVLLLLISASSVNSQASLYCRRQQKPKHKHTSGILFLSIGLMLCDDRWSIRMRCTMRLAFESKNNSGTQRIYEREKKSLLFLRFSLRAWLSFWYMLFVTISLVYCDRMQSKRKQIHTNTVLPTGRMCAWEICCAKCFYPFPSHMTYENDMCEIYSLMYWYVFIVVVVVLCSRMHYWPTIGKIPHAIPYANAYVLFLCLLVFQFLNR